MVSAAVEASWVLSEESAAGVSSLPRRVCVTAENPAGAVGMEQTQRGEDTEDAADEDAEFNQAHHAAQCTVDPPELEGFDGAREEVGHQTEDNGRGHPKEEEGHDGGHHVGLAAFDSQVAAEPLVGEGRHEQSHEIAGGGEEFANEAVAPTRNECPDDDEGKEDVEHK